jgi:hypothetical protein
LLEAGAGDRRVVLSAAASALKGRPPRIRHLASSGYPGAPASHNARRRSVGAAESERCCRKSRKLSSPKNPAKVCFQLSLLLQAAVRPIRSPVVAFLWADVVPHLGVCRMRRRSGKISSTTQEILFRQHRPASDIRTRIELQASVPQLSGHGVEIEAACAESRRVVERRQWWQRAPNAWRSSPAASAQPGTW